MAKETYNHSYRETVDEIAKCLDYKKENGFNTLITKRLKELRELYADEVIKETVINEGWRIKNKKFDTEAHKISYFFAIIKNNIYFYDRRYKENKTFNEKMKLQNENNFISEDIVTATNNNQRIDNSRDISSILEEIE